MDTLRFEEARRQVLNGERNTGGIGTLSEKTLHAVLKQYFEPYADSQEVKIGGFVADIVGEDGIVEIQTRAFDRLRRKLETFLSVARVTVVYPIPAVKWMRWLDTETGEMTDRRKSPRRGTVWDVFYELYKIRPLLTHDHFRLCIVLLEVEDIRFLNGWSRDRKRGSSRCERLPLAILEELYINGPADFRSFFPADLPERFTAASLSKAVRVPVDRVRTALQIMNDIGTVKRVDKQGNAFVYELSDG